MNEDSFLDAYWEDRISGAYEPDVWHDADYDYEDYDDES